MCIVGSIVNYAASLRAITQYHKLKMDEVNKIIQELWIKIYRGGGDQGFFQGFFQDLVQGGSKYEILQISGG